MGEQQRLTQDDWHQRYRQQASWSGDIRRYLIAKANPGFGDKILEVGSGTGAVLEALKAETSATCYGIDLNFAPLHFSSNENPSLYFAAADGYRLPFPDDSFRISLCHYLLLWVQDPQAILSEMVRVTRPGGSVLALAEPDYQARLDYPPPLDQLGAHQTQSLVDQGADTAIGRKLAGLFHKAGLGEIAGGILGAQWEKMDYRTMDEMEWMMIQSDLSGNLSQESLINFQQAEIKARNQGERILFIPTFYAAGIIQ
jgi:SAM-dependent methyltransferase